VEEVAARPMLRDWMSVACPKQVGPGRTAWDGVALSGRPCLRNRGFCGRVVSRCAAATWRCAWMLWGVPVRLGLCLWLGSISWTCASVRRRIDDWLAIM
jgi:hypothetical protein